MKTKLCSKCKKCYKLELFHKDRHKKDGLAPACKHCKIKFNIENKDKIKKQQDRFKKDNIDLINSRKRDSRRLRKLEIDSYPADKRNECIAKIRSDNNAYYKKNKDRIKANAAINYDKNRESKNEQQRKYLKNVINKDEVKKLKSKMRKMIYRVISRKGYTKRSSCTDILGCSWEVLKKHLEDTFELNYGIPRMHLPWDMVHIDHIIPLKMATTEIEVLGLNKYQNLQVLFAKDNLEKSDKLDWEIT